MLGPCHAKVALLPLDEKTASSGYKEWYVREPYVRDLLRGSEYSSMCAWNVVRKAIRRSPLVAYLLCCVWVIEGVSTSEEVPTRVMRRYISSSKGSCASSGRKRRYKCVTLSRQRVDTALPVGRHRATACGKEGWWWMVKRPVGCMSISGLMGVWFMEIV
jgi:hypothetical protein